MTGVRRVVYHANRLQGEPTIYVTEGEMDADLLWSHGLPATTNPGGAGKWRAEYATMLKSAGCQWVVILTDNDPPGEKHGRDVARSCSDAMRSREVQKGPVQEQVFRVRDMRRSDLERLSVLYKGLDETAETPGPAAALEVDVPDWDRLREYLGGSERRATIRHRLVGASSRNLPSHLDQRSALCMHSEYR